MAIYQLPDSNALDDQKAVLKLLAKLKQSFPADLDYTVSLDTTLAVTQGMQDIIRTLVIALVLVLIVVFIFLQGWRASLIPLLAVPVALIGTFAFFPIFGFSLNTLSLFGLVLAVGLVVTMPLSLSKPPSVILKQASSPRTPRSRRWTKSPPRSFRSLSFSRRFLFPPFSSPASPGDSTSNLR